MIRDYRDRGCPPPVLPEGAQITRMLEVISAGTVTDEYVDYICADLRFTDRDQSGPVLASEPRDRAGFPVVVIGCGEAGLLAGIKLKQAGIPFSIVEKKSGPGGTWLANRYPGCRVDIASQHYAYSFEAGDHWTHLYAEEPEILEYLTGDWDDDDAVWHVRIRGTDGRTETLTARGLICAVRQFGTAAIPDIKGANDFGMGKRTLQDNGTWLTTLARDDVELVAGPVTEITGDGLVGCDGVHRPADVLNWATGFDVNHQLGPIGFGGVDGVDLGEAWGDEPYAYLGVTVPGFPNLYCDVDAER